MFAIEDSGDIVLGDLSDLNTSTAHLVAVATDTGIPPRQVGVRFIFSLIHILLYFIFFIGFGTRHCTFARHDCQVCWSNIC